MYEETLSGAAREESVPAAIWTQFYTLGTWLRPGRAVQRPAQTVRSSRTFRGTWEEDLKNSLGLLRGMIYLGATVVRTERPNM